MTDPVRPRPRPPFAATTPVVPPTAPPATVRSLESAVGMLSEVNAGWPSHVTADVSVERIALSDAEIRERMSGNICRCAAYPNIVAAIRDVAGAVSE